MVRRPAVAGMFYKQDFQGLGEQIKDSFISKLGPGKLPGKVKKGRIDGAIIPHAGYVYSGSCAAHAYKALAEAETPDTYVIIAPNHTGLGYDSVLLDDMETPLGRVKTDYDLARAIVERTKLVDHNLAHLREHAIEVHLPFLQFISHKDVDDLKIVAIVVGMTDYSKLGSELRDIAKEQGKKICVIASSDFTHHGENFGYSPYTEKIKENIKKLDDGAYKYIKNNDSKGLLSYIEETGATVCGIYPILVLLEFLDGKNPELLCHYSSGELSGDYENCVDYMSIIFRS